MSPRCSHGQALHPLAHCREHFKSQVLPREASGRVPSFHGAALAPPLCRGALCGQAGLRLRGAGSPWGLSVSQGSEPPGGRGPDQAGCLQRGRGGGSRGRGLGSRLWARCSLTACPPEQNPEGSEEGDASSASSHQPGAGDASGWRHDSQWSAAADPPFLPQPPRTL